MSKSGRWQLLCGLWLLFLLVYLVWGGIAQAGLYYWVGTLEVDRFGAYDPMMTGVVPGLLLALPALVFLGREARRLRGARPGGPGSVALIRRRVAILLCVTGAIALAAAIAFYLTAEAQPGGGYERALPFDPARLGASPAPGFKVRIAGTIVDTPQISISEGSRGSTWTISYSAFRPAGDDGKGAPPRLFVERRESGHSDGTIVLADGDEQGYLVEDGLPPLVRYAFERQGLRIASPHYLLRTGSALRTPYYVGAALTTLLGCLLVGLGTLLLVLPARGQSRTMAEGGS